MEKEWEVIQLLERVNREWGLSVLSASLEDENQPAPYIPTFFYY